MREYVLFSLGELLDEPTIDLEMLKSSLSEFTCEKEHDLEDFLRQKAITYQRSDLGKTSLIVDKQKLEKDHKFVVMAFFTIAQTSVNIAEMSKSKKRAILGNVPGRDKMVNFSAFLIGQIGRSDKYNSDDLPGITLLDECYSEIQKAQRIIGGKLIVLECRKHMFELFYEKQGYRKLNDELQNGLYTLYKRI